jgi:hypothetical protein
MDHPTVMYVFRFVMSPIFVVFLVALLGLSIATNLRLWKERMNIINKFGKDATEWMVG